MPSSSADEPSTLEIEREALLLFERLLDVPDGERLAWIRERTRGRPKLRQRLIAMLEADSLHNLKTGAAVEAVEPEAEPERIGAYRITGLIGRGGMGSVYKGERIRGDGSFGDFAHTVAIKVVKAGLLSESLVERFRRERQTLAGLTHPNIAQLYDGGETEDGAPYIIMEWVDGLTLLQWAERENPSHDQRLALFEDMCRAVACAHRSLIVHRDLTPSNVLVTRDGVVKLIDFGIARPTNNTADGTAEGTPSKQTAVLSLTPGYAAPERLTGAEVTTAADVYSLGRLLDRLVTQPDADLKAIIACATAQNPADRYATADALRQDVEAVRRGYPISVRRREGGYVAGKFIRRHRLSVAAASVAVLALASAFGMVVAASHKERLARAEAEKRFEETRGIANRLVFDVYDAVSQVPGATRARELLARTGVEYLDKLAADPDAPVAVRIEAGSGYVRLAQVTGGGQESTLGRYREATALLAKGEAILQQVYAEHPGDAAAIAYARLLIEQAGDNLYNDNDPDKARAQALLVQRLLKDHASAAPDLANTYLLAIQAEGDSWLWSDDYAKARDVLLRADAFYKGLPEAMRNDLTVLGGRSSSLRLLGEAWHRLKKPDEAKAVLAENVGVNRERHRRDPDNPKVMRGLILALRYSAIVHRTNYRDAEAKAAISEAFSLAQAWQTRDPADAGALELVAATGEVYAQILADQKQYAQSEQVSDAVIATQKRRIELSGGAPFAVRGLATALMTRGGNFYNAGRYDKACATWKDTQDAWEQLAARGQLSKTDRDNGYAQVKDLRRRTCNPPRAGLPEGEV